MVSVPDKENVEGEKVIKSIYEIRIGNRSANEYRDKLLELIKQQIGVYESFGTVCHQWDANTLRNLIDWFDRKPKPFPNEKRNAIGNIRTIMKNYELSLDDINKVG